jgi:hypothetical protein
MAQATADFTPEPDEQLTISDPRSAGDRRHHSEARGKRSTHQRPRRWRDRRADRVDRRNAPARDRRDWRNPPRNIFRARHSQRDHVRRRRGELGHARPTLNQRGTAAPPAAQWHHGRGQLDRRHEHTRPSHIGRAHRRRLHQLLIPARCRFSHAGTKPRASTASIAAPASP